MVFGWGKKTEDKGTLGDGTAAAADNSKVDEAAMEELEAEEEAEEEEEEAEGDAEGEGEGEGEVEGEGDGEGEEEEEAPQPKKKKKKKKDNEPEKNARYNVEIFDITFTNSLEEPISPFFHFTVGSKTKKVDKRDEGGGIEEKITEGPKFETDTVLRIPPEDMGQYKRTKKMKWFGTYAELHEEKLRIRVIHRPPCCLRCGFDQYRGCKRATIVEINKPLVLIANGCVTQEFDIVEDRRRVGLVGVGTLRFYIFFEEVYDFQVECLEWQGRDLFAADEGGTSDPYLVLSIKGDWHKLFTAGGLRNRKVVSDTEYNTLFPKWAELPHPLLYNGTWSELQNEIFMIQVYDRDNLGADSLIGWTRVPLQGQFRDNGDNAEGQIRSGLARTKTEKQEVYAGKKQNVKVVYPGGEIVGTLRIEAMPKYKQFGGPTRLKSGVQYICIEIDSAHNLPATDENGLTDAFFVVEWEGMVQKTKVVFKTLEPVFKEKLYFPVLLFKFDADELAKKEPYMKLNCFDFDPDGTCDFQGFAEFYLWEITAAKPSSVDGQMRRCATKNNVPLQKSRSKNAHVNFRVWFEPSPLADEDGDEIILDKPKTKEIATLDQLYTDRAIEWMDAMKQMAPRAWRKAQPLGGFIYKNADERSIEHFLPCYLHPLAGPLDLQNPREVFRMVSCIAYETDIETSGGHDADSWVSPKFFLDIKKGDSEDHCILAANLFLGLSIDCYIAVGKAKVRTVDELTDEVTIGPGEETHCWVVSRKPDGSVIFWECCTGKEYMLMKRWRGSDDNPEEEEDEEEGENAEEENQDDEDDQAFAAFYEADTTLNKEQLSAKDFWRTEMIDAAAVDDSDASDADVDLGLPTPVVQPPYHSLQVMFNHENVWANIQSLDPLNCMFEIDDPTLWKPFCSFEDGFSLDVSQTLPFYKPPSIPARLKAVRAKKIMSEILQHVKDGVGYIRGNKMLEWKCFEPEKIKQSNKDGPKHMQEHLARGLKLMEDRLLAHNETKRDTIMSRLGSWKADLMKSSPDNVSFEGIPINFSYCDGKRIKNRICDKYEEFLMDSEMDVQFVFGVYVAPYYCSVNSTWVYIGKMKPLPEAD